MAACALTVAGCAASGPAADETDDAEVPVGYGTLPASRVTGSVSQVTPDAGDRAAAQTVIDLIAGRVPGLSVIRSRSGAPTLQIRGAGSFSGPIEPLVVVDGTAAWDVQILNQMNPNDVASVTVLKGAEAAIYGSRAAGGVVLVTTRR